ncbi:MAG: hypothetical protein F8N39_10930 [Clostridiaceae bacterium]|nr:hypothetical protein [Clostridiaceae bacterium]
MFKLNPIRIDIIEFLENKSEDYKFLCKEKNIKFYRGDVSRSKEKGHSGLGMYIVKTLVEKHNGWITVENR